MLTKSEKLFEQICHHYSLPCQRIPTASTQRRDYQITLHSGRLAYVEVKQFDPSSQERRVLDAGFEKGWVEWPSILPGERIRSAIYKARPQLKSAMAQGHPCILVVMNNVLNRRLHTDSYAVLTAMRGLDVVTVTLSQDPALSPTYSPPRPGPRKKLTPKENTTISAIAVLYEGADNDKLCLDVFHNRHARFSIVPVELKGETIRHFKMRNDEGGWESF